MIVKERSLLLIQLRTPTRPVPIWTPPGGEVRFGESLTDALKREVHEETGLTVRPVRLSMVHEFLESPWHAIEFYFLCDLLDGELAPGVDPERGDGEQILQEAAFIPFSRLGEQNVEPQELSLQPERVTAREADPLYLWSTDSDS